MRLFGRRSDGPVATYAAVLDGAHLWLDLDGAVSLREAATGEEAAPMAPPEPVTTAFLPLTRPEVMAHRNETQIALCVGDQDVDREFRTPELSPRFSHRRTIARHVHRVRVLPGER